MKIKILAADDHPIFRNGVVSFLRNDFPDAYICDVKNGKKALDKLTSEHFDIAILDIDMPEKNGLEVCKELKDRGILTRVIMLTIYNDSEILRKALEYDVVGFLVKENTAEELKECIETILNGESYIAHSLRFIKEIHSKKKNHSILLDQLRTLSDTELKTLFLVSEKYSSKEISNLLFVTPKSIENYRSRICKKLDLPSSNNSLLVWAIDHKDIIDEFEKISRLKS